MSFRSFLILSLVSGTVLCTAPLFSQWLQTNGPFGGRINSFARDGDLLYAGCDGGLFVSTDDGEAWSKIDLDIVGQRVLEVSIHKEMVYVGTQTGIYRSDRELADWEQVTSGVPDTVVAILFSNEDYLFAGFSHYGLFRSADGAGWETVGEGVLPLESIMEDILGTDEGIFLAMNRGLFFSGDDGLNWSPRDSTLGGSQTRVRALTTMGPFILAGTTTLTQVDTSADLYRSGNGGISWTKIGSLPIDPSAGDRPTVLLANVANLFAGTTVGVFQSVDSGKTWLSTNTGLTNDEVSDLIQLEYPMLAGTAGGVFRSTNNGAEWFESNDGLIGTRVRKIVRKGTKIFACSPVSGVFCSTDQGDHWLHVDATLPTRRVPCLAVVGGYLFAGTQEDGIFRSGDDGNTWEPVAVNPSNKDISVIIASGAFMYAGTDSGVSRSSDTGINTGLTWEDAGLDGLSIHSMAVSGGFLWAGTDGAGLWRSDNGVDWTDTKQEGLEDSTIFSIGVVGADTYVGTEHKGIFKSPNNGGQWSAINFGMPDTTVASIVSVGGNPSNLFIATSEQGCYKSTNTGETWGLWNEGLEVLSLTTIVVSDSMLFAGTGGGGIVKRLFPPGTPQLVNPEPSVGDLTPPVSFSWMPASGASSYDFQIALTAVFANPVVDESGIPTATLEVTSLARHTHYYWRVRAGGPGGKGQFSAVREFSTSDSMTFSSTLVHEFPDQPSVATDYRIVSVPGVSPLKAGELFSGTQGIDWKMFDDNGNAPPDHLTELSADTELTPGEGYWLVTGGLFDFSKTVLMPPLDTLGCYGIAVDTGWNIIGNPFEVPVSVSSVRSVNQLDPVTMFSTYLGDTNFVSEEFLLKPFTGYYFYNMPEAGNPADTVLAIPYPFPASVFPTGNFPVPLWRLQVMLETPAGVDTENYLGVLPESERGRDRFDQPAPPVPGNQPVLSFVLMEADAGFTKFQTDYRPAGGEGERWSFETAGPALSEATIRFNGIEAVPGNAEVVLLDEMRGVHQDLRETGTYTFHAGNEKGVFAVLIGSEAFVQGELASTVPSEFELSQNYPNPFNPTTRITVGIPYSTEVQLEISSILGAKVTTLAGGRRDPGRYTFVWDGRNSLGDHVASGIYFYRLIAGGNQIVAKKMILLR